MRRQRILTLHRKLTPKAPQRYACVVPGDPENTCRLLPWAHAEGEIVPSIHQVELLDGKTLKPVGDLMALLRQGNHALPPWAALFGSIGVIPRVAEATVYKVTEVKS